jgi:hypothetical protein
MKNPMITSVLACGLLFGLSGCSEAQSGANVNTRRGQTLNGFNVSNAIIPIGEIRSGGPPRDGIPAIDRPQFIPAARADFLRDEDIVISLSAQGRARAYPLRILVWHEIVNDEFGGQAVAVTYCPLCGTAMVFDRSIGGRTLSFGVSGLLYQSDVLMYDRQTESLWSQLKMQAVSGPLVETQLPWLPSEHLTWAAWRQKYPEAEVLSTNTGHRRDYTQQPYRGYEQTPQTIFPVPQFRPELPNKEWVIGIIIGAEAKAYPVAGLHSHQIVSDVVGGQEVRVAYDPAQRRPTVVRADTGEAIPYVMVYWFAWQAFYPGTAVWGGEGLQP